MRLIIITLLAFAPLLKADTVETQKKQSFEGIVVQFSDKAVRLDTGYGVLDFDRKKQIESISMVEYDWPGDSAAPERPEAFLKWAEAEAAKRIQLVEVPTKLEDDEVSCAGFAERYTEVWKIQQDKALSIKEKRDQISKYTYKFAYLAAVVSSVTVEKNDRIKITIDKGKWYDSRSGKPIALDHQPITIWAEKGLNGKALDARQDEDDKYHWIDYDTAEEMKAGSAIVLKEGFSSETGEVVWTTRTTRFKPRKPLKDR